MGKGDNRRDARVPQATIAANWERTFKLQPTKYAEPVHQHYCARCGAQAVRIDGEVKCLECKPVAKDCPCARAVCTCFPADSERDARIARHLKAVLPAIYRQMEKELFDPNWPGGPDGTV